MLPLLLLAHFLFLTGANCVPGGIYNGTWHNYTTAIPANSSINPLSSMINDINCNLPWYMAFILLLFYVGLYILFNEVPDRKKFMVIALIPMIISWIMITFSWADPVLGDVTTAIFIVVSVLVYITGG